jgi:hypothetical protein
LCYQKQISMLQQNFTSLQLPVKIIHPLVTVKNSSLSTRNDIEDKACKHRNENDWCSKSQRQCLLLTNLFFKH